MTCPTPFRGLRRRLLAVLASTAFVVSSFSVGWAQDGEGGGEESPEAVQQKIKAQMEKVLKLMRENQQALLEASLRGGKRPDAPEVVPPDAPEAPAMESGAGGEGQPPPKEGETPPAGGSESSGDKSKREVEELIRTTQATGGSIPGELETLVRMIPSQGGGGGGGSGGDPSGDAEGRKEMGEQPEPKDGTKTPKEEPSDGKPKPGDKPPPEAEKGPPPPDAPPAWWTSLPDSVRQAIVSGRTEDVPPRYRSRIEAYRKWLAQQASRAR